MIPEAAVEAAAIAIFQNQTGMDWESRSNALKSRFIDDARAALEAAAPHMLAPLVADLDKWAGRSRTGFYDEAQDDVVQILHPYRSQG